MCSLSARTSNECLTNVEWQIYIIIKREKREVKMYMKNCLQCVQQRYNQKTHVSTAMCTIKLMCQLKSYPFVLSSDTVGHMNLLNQLCSYQSLRLFYPVSYGFPFPNFILQMPLIKIYSARCFHKQCRSASSAITSLCNI